MRKICLGVLLAFSLNAGAAEIEGVKLVDHVSVGGQELVLNGAGVRTFLFLDMYVAALYLPAKQSSVEGVLADKGAHRIELHVLRDASVSRFMGAFRKGMTKNSSSQELAALEPRMDSFEHLFNGTEEVTKGSVIVFDGVPGEGLRASLNGKELGRVAGDDFFRALLRIWLGDDPVQDSLKKGLLGG